MTSFVLCVINSLTICMALM